MRRIITTLALCAACNVPTGATGATGATAPDVDAAAAIGPTQLITVEHSWADVGDKGLPPETSPDRDAGVPAEATIAPATPPTTDASVTVTLDPDAAPYCEVYINGSSLPWNCDDVCGTGAERRPCTGPTAQPTTYRPAPPAPEDAMPREWATYTGACNDVQQCPDTGQDYMVLGLPTNMPAVCSDFMNNSGYVCSEPCTRLYACCENMDDSDGCAPVLTLDAETYAAWCSRELAVVSC